MFGFKTIQVKWICVIVFRTSPCIKNGHTTPVRIYSEPSSGNITRRQAISLVAKFHHVLWRGFMIQRVNLIFIKCLSANQNQLFYIKVKYIYIDHQRSLTCECETAKT